MQQAMKSPFVNRFLNISSEDVVECTDPIQLKEWLMLIEADIASIEIHISLLTKDPFYDHDKWHKSTVYLNIQKGLRRMICGRINIVRAFNSKSALLKEISFWKEKVKYLAPTKMDEYNLELDMLRA